MSLHKSLLGDSEIRENLGVRDKGATERMETHQASFPERGGMLRWKTMGKENILGCKTAAGFCWISHLPW